jgi:hypothetical protein
VAAQRLAGEGVRGYMERSRRGGHLWLFFAEPVSGGLARAFGRGIQAAFDLEDVELYPKQEVLRDGPGSLIRLPFGIHRRSGRRYGFITPTGAALAPTVRQQLAALKNPETVSEAAFSAYQSRVDGRFEPKPMVVTLATAETVSGRIKQSVSVLEFVSQFVDLSAKGVGKCPFHADEHESFAVNDRGNYWHCFAGCGGGSAIDFWMKRQGCDFTTAVTELAKMLL